MAGGQQGGLPVPDAIRAVLFDLDDTLVDARGAWRRGFAETIAELYAGSPALRALGTSEVIYDGHFRNYSEAAHRAAGGGEWQERFTLEAFERLLAEHLEPDPALAERLSRHYRAAILDHVEAVPDAVATLEAVGTRYPLGLISNGPRELQRPKLRRFGLDRYFATIVISGEVGVVKPDPAIFRLALAALAVPAAAAVYVGDNPHHDVAGACAAGLAAIWVNRGDWG
ncbi:MAG: HAD family hydrolase, partial [Chloroflexi bacterium]|nr:HAD family hydrolase [Chloroflexota bacterium]